MAIDVKDVEEGACYRAGRQVRRVDKIAIKTVERGRGPNKKKKRVKRVWYSARGGYATMPFGGSVWADIETFANDVDKKVECSWDVRHDA